MLKIRDQKVWILSDIHAQHKNLCRGTSTWTDKSGCRDFSCPEEMWEVIRDNLNKKVQSSHLIIHEGDFIFGKKDNLPKLLREVNCPNWIHLFGNHDDWMKQDKNRHFLTYFNRGCHNYLEVVILNRLFILNHYRQLIWRDQHEGSIHCYGHSHGTSPDDLNSLSIDTGCETKLFNHEQYTPYEDIEIISIMDKYKKFTRIDHHNENTGVSS